MPETSTQPSGSSLEQILWRAMDRFREEPALVDTEEFADRIAHAFDADLPEERFADRFFDGADRMHQKRPAFAEAFARSAKQPLHAYEFDLDRLPDQLIRARISLANSGVTPWMRHDTASSAERFL